ncbi:DUF3365 domain-containing protein [Roseomonas sp. OT10]|uniref:c-type heme family protein n=1 Tax=Roseomonas cutis TaxID=2897332 RepID=UPI001E4445FE|nr:DUF3365 domain-containing protein [Roseomonas sp. OT10]UFN50503.1 DUF3365 domain-containing protein [Roseomonas sp. OT10]
MGLRVKFNLVMVGALLVGLLLAAYFARGIAEETARRQVQQEATLLMLQATAVRGYTAGEVAPLLNEQSQLRFLPHTVPSWSAQTVFRTVQKSFPDYDYKEAALNPTNPADRATDWEADIINLFRRDQQLAQHFGERETPAGPVLTFARPFRLTDRNCLACHSTPSAAPAAMIDLYGPNNGFGWQLGDVIGAQIVSVPMRVALDRANTTLIAFLSSLGAVFLAVLLLLNLLLHVFIIKPVQRMTGMAERVAAGEMDMPEYQVTGKDEIASLARSFNLMRRSLANAMKMLEEG